MGTFLARFKITAFLRLNVTINKKLKLLIRKKKSVKAVIEPSESLRCEPLGARDDKRKEKLKN